MAPAVGFAVFLIALGNGVSALPNTLHRDFAWALMAGNLALMAASLAWATRSVGLSWAKIGLARSGLRRGAALGLLAGGVVIAPVVLYFLFPVGLPGGEIEYAETRSMSGASFASFILLRQPLGTSIFEETMFRGILQACSLKAFGIRPGIAFVATVFAMWHVVVNLDTIDDSNAGDSAVVAGVAVAASMVALVAGSVAMSLLRHRAGSLMAPIAFHWVVVVLMQGTLFLQSRS